MTLDLVPNAGLVGAPDGRRRLQTPVLVLDLEALDRNVARMAAHCRTAGLRLRPHAKTHKSVEIARRQVAAGAVGLCCVTIGEAEALAAGGIPNLLLTSPVVGEGKLARLAALLAEAGDLSVVADDPANVAALGEVAARAGRTLTVLVDIDVGSRRTGVPSAQAAVALARRIAATRGLAFGGIQGYAGHLQHIVSFEERRQRTAEVAGWIRRTVAELTDAGLPPPLVTGGGTGTHAIEPECGVLGELQAGSYTVMDVDYGRVALAGDGPQPFEHALFVATTVVSAAQEGMAITDGGLKAFATDGPPPLIARGAPPGAVYGYAGDEHGRVTLPPGRALKVGDVLECVATHCDPNINLFDHYHVVEGDRLVAIWPVDARGKR